VTTLSPALDFVLPYELAAHEPPEARGLDRDEVKLMVSRVHDDAIINTCFFRFPEFVASGDVLVVNTSATINAAFESGDFTLNLSTPISDTKWVVELRRNSEKGTAPFLDARAGEIISLPGGGTAQLVEPYMRGNMLSGRVRLWAADLDLPTDVLSFAREHGAPVRYDYVPDRWPLSYYQTVFSYDPGSAEMPSAGRAFTRETVTRLRRKGVTIAPVVLHTGVSSLEADEAPYPERYRVPAATARAVNSARAKGARVIAVGTTVVRALETVADENGIVHPGHGWTDLVITPDRGVRGVDAILTGLHAPRATHLSMLEAFAPVEHLSVAYDNALAENYLWHEFGDLHLIVP
jgi:S-adenosylmethionine:tRNA ribosyltransferase-isomerase